jgi:hypothetical protein
MNCPGSVAAIAALPPGEPSIYAAQGTVAHAEAERILANIQAGKDPEWDKNLGYELEADGFDIEVDDEMLDGVRQYVEYLTNTLERLGLSAKDDLVVEQRFALEHIDKEAYGTSDAVIVAPMNRLFVADLKYGRSFVNHVNNPQLRIYALGAYYKLPEMDRLDLSGVETIIAQPRVGQFPDTIRSEFIGVDELLAFEKDYTAAILRVRMGDTTRKAGKWCKYCTAKATCEAVREDIARSAFDDFQHVLTREVQPPAPEALTEQQLAFVLDNADRIKGWADDVFGYAFRLAEAGKRVPGWKLVKKTGNRKWKDVTKAEKQVAKLLDDTKRPKMYKPPVLQSPNQIEKLLGSKRKAEIEDLYMIPEGKPTLVRDADARKKTAPAIASDFAGLLLDNL